MGCTEIPGSSTQFVLSTRHSKSMGCWHSAKNGRPSKITLYPKNIMDIWGNDEAAFIVGLCVYGLTELLCLRRSEEHPRKRRHCGHMCPPEKIAFNMIHHTLDGD